MNSSFRSTIKMSLLTLHNMFHLVFTVQSAVFVSAGWMVLTSFRILHAMFKHYCQTSVICNPVPTENNTRPWCRAVCLHKLVWDLALKVYSCLSLPWRQPPGGSSGLQTTMQPLLAALAEAMHVGEVLGEIILPVVLQVLLVALEQLGSAGLWRDPTGRQAGPWHVQDDGG